ncbi:MAG: leucine-rich repeat domain-containing protein [Tannerella sp.]|jgi:hypothetical protein|nr:leucine-rich repeat domain-containing protein [Tannerella sp.]
MKKKNFRELVVLLFLLAAMSFVCQGQTVFSSESISYTVTGDAEVAVHKARNVAGSVTIPETVEYGGVTYKVTGIGEAAFLKQENLTSITIPNSVTSIGKAAFLYCTNLVSVSVGNGVTSIGVIAFADCSSLTSINIPKGVTSIERLTFSGCSSLASITIPGSVTSIGFCAFVDCKSLTQVTVEWKTPLENVNSEAFNGLKMSSLILYTPAGTESAYQTVSVWNEFKIIGKNELTEIKSGEIAGSESVENSPLTVIANGTLTISSPVSEQVYIYSVGGALLYQTQKDVGEAKFDINHLPQGVLIVKGSSGWVSKTMK